MIAEGAVTDSASGWEHDCLTRERREITLTLMLACVIYPGYGVIDHLFEPDLALWRARVIGMALLVAALVVVRRARTLALVRGAFCVTVGVIGPMVAAMLPAVSHYATYLMGYSAFFWGVMIVSWPMRYTIGLFVWQLATVVAALAITPSTLTGADYLGAAFLLVTAATLTAAAVYARRVAIHRAFLASHALADRNAILERTMAELRDAQARLVVSEKLSALGRLLAGLSHEINNPVNIIKNNLDPVREHFDAMLAVLELARTTEAEDLARLRRAWQDHELDWRATDLDDALRSMQTAVGHIQQIHGDLRAFIRGDKRGTSVVDINDGLRATVGLFTRRLSDTVQIDLELGELPGIECHPGELNQVWLNLVQNALDAIGPAGCVTVRSRRTGAAVEVTVTDDGPGIDPAFRSRLFEPFATTKDPGHGTGLGLATSYQIVQRHGGRIYIDESYASGTRFKVELPQRPGA
jgi:signal transduction histidine kinase